MNNDLTWVPRSFCNSSHKYGGFDKEKFRNGLREIQGNKVMPGENTVGDELDFDEKATQNGIDIFLQSLLGSFKPKDLK